ncbi:DUF896 domain-containing protein [Paenibacillus chibensis]|uniref:DUF896 domain-containing protein n=1 Tax=Paenibacillus chibensis TaxID=59846 RepID=UPI000FDA9148|nr:DUF896 domain-containing protein [Paenibacillus chibensis]MEC0371524.1 DUF896 domain-containing protein [Paenibacillus chibensis]
MDIDSLVQRINELARKLKESGLSKEETEERAKLREQYLQNVRRNFKAQLETIEWVEDQQDGKGK